MIEKKGEKRLDLKKFHRFVTEKWNYEAELSKQTFSEGYQLCAGASFLRVHCSFPAVRYVFVD